MFNWKRFLERHGIEYVTRGPNVGRGHINIKCPFCGSADPSEHLGISLRGEGWGCWRNSRHRGKSRAKLIQALLRCSWERAVELAGGTIETVPDVAFSDQINGLLTGKKVEQPKPRRLHLLKEFNPLYLANSPLAKPFQDYFADRDYTVGETKWLTKTYDLHYATRGKFGYRIIIPLWDANRRLISWTGRTILADEELRYKALSVEDKDTPALAPPGDTLLGVEFLWHVKKPKVLVVCEGPFDAFRISAFGHREGVWGTCLFGLNVSEAQSLILEDLAGRFDRVRLLLDDDALLQTFRLTQRLNRTVIKPVKLPAGVADPGDLNWEQAAPLIGQMLS